MIRPTFTTCYLELAQNLSRRSTCCRLQVGCVITSPDFRRVYSVGYNGNYAGGPNECDRFGEEAVGNCGCLHAEENAIINCDVPRSSEKIVLNTHLPCVQCAKRLVNLGGVQSVLYLQDYRIRDSVDVLLKSGIACNQVKLNST
jgi:dCMP deaminase